MRRVYGRKFNRNLNIFVMAVLLVFGIVCINGVIHKSAEGTKIVPYINDGTVDWKNIHSLYIYSDGYYGRSLEEPLLIEDAKTIENIVRKVLKEEQYHKIPSELYYEGTNAFFIQFDNGVWICMYEDEDYGCVSDHLDYSGSNCYYLPRGLRTKIMRLLERYAEE